MSYLHIIAFPSHQQKKKRKTNNDKTDARNEAPKYEKIRAATEEPTWVFLTCDVPFNTKELFQI